MQLNERGHTQSVLTSIRNVEPGNWVACDRCKAQQEQRQTNAGFTGSPYPLPASTRLLWCSGAQRVTSRDRTRASAANTAPLNPPPLMLRIFLRKASGLTRQPTGEYERQRKN
jgi:hypothetical protein